MPADAAARRASWNELAESGGKHVCCALPALLVALGAGAALASVVSAVPQLVWFSLWKGEVFGLAGIALAIAGAMQWRARRAPCPADPALAAACARARRASRVVYGASLAVFGVGAFFAFAAPL